MVIQTNSDHDLLIRVDQNIKNLLDEFIHFKGTVTNLEIRVRFVEDAITKLLPIPSVSHEEVVKDIAKLNGRVDGLYNSRETVLGGWKGITILLGGTATLIGIVYFIIMILKR